MNISKEDVENIGILCNRLQCLLKCISINELNIIEELILLNLARELAYNINATIQNI